MTKISFKILQNLKFENHEKSRILLALWLELCSKFKVLFLGLYCPNTNKQEISNFFDQND